MSDLRPPNEDRANIDDDDVTAPPRTVDAASDAPRLRETAESTPPSLVDETAPMMRAVENSDDVDSGVDVVGRDTVGRAESTRTACLAMNDVERDAASDDVASDDVASDDVASREVESDDVARQVTSSDDASLDAPDDFNADVTQPVFRSPPSSSLHVERAGRRSQRGLAFGLSTTVLTVGAPVLLAAAVVIALVRIEDAPPVVAAPSPPPDVSAIEADLRGYDASVRAAERAAAESAAKEILSSLKSELPRLQAAIAVARDARKLKADGVSLSAPFSADELQADVGAMGLGVERGRFITTRQGDVVLPKGARVHEASAIASSTTDQDDKITVDVLGDAPGTALRVTVRTCLAREKHCLVEISQSDLKGADVAASLAQLAVLAAPVAPSTSSSSNEDTARIKREILIAVTGAFLLALFCVWLALSSTRRFSRLVRSRAQEARALPLYAPKGDGTRVPSEIALLDDALAHVAMSLAAHTQTESRLRALVHEVGRATDAILMLSKGDVDDAPVLTGDAHTLGAAIELLVGDIRRHATRIDGHLSALKMEPSTRESAKTDIVRRIEGLKPLAMLLSDISARTRALSRNVDDNTAADLERLSDAVEKRAKTAQQLLDALDAATTAIPVEEGAWGPRQQMAITALQTEMQRARSRHLLDVIAANADLGIDETRARVVDGARAH